MSICARDLAGVASKYGATGTAINKTGLLLELLDRVETLENQSTPLGYVGAPAYDSGWINISKGQNLVLTHNLNTTEVLVYVIGNSSNGIHHVSYGGELDRIGTDLFTFGLIWRGLTNTTILVTRLEHDATWEQVRVMIWKIQPTP